MPITYASLLLVSDDNESLAELSGHLRELALYEVTITSTVAQAEELAGAQTFDIVLLDVTMQGCAAPLQFFARWRDTVPVPVIVFGRATDIPALTTCVQQGAHDYLLLPTNPTFLRARVQAHLQRKRLQEQALSALSAFNEVEKLADDLRLVILPLGIALSSEEDFARLGERFLAEAMELCSADAGALFLNTAVDTLHYELLRVNSLGLAYGGTTNQPVPFADLPLYRDGEPSLDNVATFVAHEALTINIADVYDESGFDFSGTRAFDARNGYRTISCLTVPLQTNGVLGVLQLRNARDPLTGHTIAFGAYQQLVAESLASQAAVALHNRRLREQETALLRYKRELQIGRDIQATFFPRALPQPPGWEIAARFQPAREVAGDFYDVFAAPNGRIGLVIADVCDKGVVAALYMALLRSLLRAFLQQHYYLATQPPEAGGPPPPLDDAAALLDALRLTNAYIGHNHGDAHVFATLFIGLLDPATGELLYANCGHLPPLLQEADGRVQRLMPTGPAVGLLPAAQFSVGRATLPPGARLLAYTDGVTEARANGGPLFGAARLDAALAADPGEPVEALLARLQTAVGAHLGEVELPDDIALLAVRRAP